MTVLEDIPASLDRRHEAPIVFSFTFLNTYLNICPYQAWRKYIKRDIPFKETVAMARGNRIHAEMEARIKGKPLPDDSRPFERFAAPFDGKNPIAEQKLGITRQGQACDFFAKNVFGRGKLDVTLIKGDAAYICDWKSGSSKYESPFELEIFAMLLHAKHPTLKTFKGQYVYLGENNIGTMYDLSHTRQTWEKVNVTMAEVEAAKQRKDAGFEKRQGPLCGWCEVKNCEYNKNANA